MSLQHTSSPRHSQNTQPPRTALLVDRYERQHTVLDTQLPQVPSSQNVTTRGPLTNLCPPVPASLSAWTTSDPFRPLQAAIPAQYSSLTASAAEPTCAPSLQPTTQRKAPPTFLLIVSVRPVSIPSDNGLHSTSQLSRPPSLLACECVESPQAHTTLTATAVSSVSTTQWHRRFSGCDRTSGRLGSTPAARRARLQQCCQCRHRSCT